MRFRLLALLLIGVVLTGVSASIEAAEAGVAVWTEGDMLLASRPVTFAGWSARVADDAEPTLDALAA
jgi:hypothetical protein